MDDSTSAYLQNWAYSCNKLQTKLVILTKKRSVVDSYYFVCLRLRCEHDKKLKQGDFYQVCNTRTTGRQRRKGRRRKQYMNESDTKSVSLLFMLIF